jgi:hypothetical protein
MTFCETSKRKHTIRTKQEQGTLGLAATDVVTSQTVLSSDAQKGLGFVPDFQALFAWDEAEQKRRKM